MASEVTIGSDGRHEPRQQQTRRKIQRLCIPQSALETVAVWVDSDQINLSEVVPMECYTVPVETIREVER
jgi:hypothetical protein